MKKTSRLKTLLCLVLCVVLVLSLFGCTANTQTELVYGDPEQCTLCPDKEHCCFCYQYGDCVCAELQSQTGDTSATSDTQSGTTSNRAPIATDTGNTTAAGKYDPKSLKGKTVTIMRSWEPYVSGKYTSHDNFIKRVAELEKKYDFDIVEKKWSVPLEQEVLAGVKPSGQLYQVAGSGVASYAKAGYIAPWDAAMKATGIDMTSDVYLDFSVQLCNYNNKQYAIGVEEGKMAAQIIYNKTLTSQFADIEKLMDEGKWTWNAMTDIAKKVKARYPEKYGIGLNVLIAIYGMVASNGSQIVSVAKDGTIGSNLKDERVRQALEQLYKWVNDDKVAYLSTESEAWDYQINELIKGNIAFTFNGDIAYDLLKDGMSSEDYGIAYLPMGPAVDEYYTYMEASWPYVMPKAYEDQAADLLFVVDALYQLQPGYTKDTQFRDLYISRFADQTHYNRVKNMHRTIKAAPIIEIELGASNIWNTAARNLLRGNATVGQFIDSHHNEFDVYMKDTWKDFKFTGDLS